MTILGQTKGTSVNILKAFIIIMLEASNLFPQTCPTFVSLKLNFHFWFKWAMYTKCLPRQHQGVYLPWAAQSQTKISQAVWLLGVVAAVVPPLQQLLSPALWEIPQGTLWRHADTRLLAAFRYITVITRSFQEDLGNGEIEVKWPLIFFSGSC